MGDPITRQARTTNAVIAAERPRGNLSRPGGFGGLRAGPLWRSADLIVMSDRIGLARCRFQGRLSFYRTPRSR